MSKNHPLCGSRLKVIRAQEHIEALKDEINRYLESHPYEVTTKIDSNFADITVSVDRELPPRLSCIVGDCLCNLRSSLDYVAWQLATKYAGPMTDKQERAVTFPICTDRQDWKTSSRPAHLKGCCKIPATAMDCIEGVQPYQTGYEPLGLLKKLVNLDKHRLPLMAVAFFGGFFVEFQDRSVSGIRVTVADRETGKTIFNAQTGCESITGFQLNTTGPTFTKEDSLDVNMDRKLSLVVALQDVPMPFMAADLLLGDILKCVANIIPRFEPFF